MHCSLTRWTILFMLILFSSRQFAQITVTGAAAASNGTYTKLSLAFAAINGQAQTGNSIIITINSQPVSESSTAILNAGAWNSILIYPTVSGLSINGTAAPLIDYFGADNITIDGRVNLAGNADLTLINYSTGAVNTYSVIRYIHSASNNTVRYCTIRGGVTFTNSGMLFLSGSNQATGNNNNVIEYNNFTGISDELRPAYCIYSNGSTGKNNTGVIVRHNKFYDFINRSVNTAAVNATPNNLSWTIDDNHVYETSTLTTTGSSTIYGILIAGTAGGGMIVTNNYVGGSAPYCQGVFRKAGATINSFNPFFISAAAGDTNEVQGNVVNNIQWETAAGFGSVFMQINGSGYFKIGTSSPNIFGSDTGNTSIVFKVISGVNSTTVTCINASGTGTQIIKNNKMGGIRCENSFSDYSNSMFGILKSSGGDAIIENNQIGSIDSSTTYSLYLPNSPSINSQVLAGIQANGGNNTVRGNVVSKLGNFVTGGNGYVVGIGTQSGNSTITGNTVANLTIANNNPSVITYVDATGIYFTVSTGTNTGNVSGNTIYNITNTNPNFSAAIAGVFIKAPLSQVRVAGNIIHSLTATGASAGSGSVYGIKINSGITNINNNIISLGSNTVASIYGIHENCAVNNNSSMFFNTVSLSGTPASLTAKSYALYSGANTNTRDYRNNILINSRSTPGGSGALHYAAYFNYATVSGLTLDHNVYSVTGHGGVAGSYNSADVSTLPLVTGLDAGSYLSDPQLSNSAGITASSYYPHVQLIGSSGTGVTTDYFGRTRKTVPTIGAIDSVIINGGYVYLHAIPEGYLDTVNNRLRKRDTVTLYLVNGTAPYAFIDSSSATLDSLTFTSLHTFSLAASGQYYFVVRHRNSIETWSKDSTLQFSIGDTVEYNFTDSLTKAYNNNLKLKGGKYCLYTGDVNQDGYVDISDVIQIDNTANSSPTVFTTEDLNGDGIVDYDDLLAIDENYISFVQMYSPLVF